MKKSLLLLFAFMAFCGSIFALAENAFPTPPAPPAVNCQNWVYYLADYANGTTTIYEVDLDDVANTASLTALNSVNYEVHIAYNENDGLLYLIRKSDGSFRTLDVSVVNGAVSAETALDHPLSGSVEAVFAPNGKLIIGSQSSNEFIIVDINNGNTSPYATGDITGGDVAFDSSGQAFFATRSSGVLYQLNPGNINTMIGSVPNMVTGLSLKDDDSFLVSVSGSSQLLGRTNGGANNGAYDILLNGNAFTTSAGDMASGCEAPEFNQGDCQNFSMFYANHGPGINGSDIYEINFSGSDAIMNHLTSVPFETHIAYDAMSDILYLVDKHGGFVRAYDPTNDFFLGDIPMVAGLNNLHAVVFNPADGLLYVGDDGKNKIFTVDLNNGSHTFFADAPIEGGDLTIKNGVLYLGTRNGNKLYDMTGGVATLVGSIPAEINGMAQANNADGLITANYGATVFTEVDASNGNTVTTFDAMLNGSPFTTLNGDMAAGCADENQPGEECQNFTYYYISNNSPGIPNGNVYKGEIVGNDFVLTLIFNAGMRGHIALNANNGNIYVINRNGNNLQTYDASGSLLNDVPTGLPNTYALVWNPADGMVYAGSPTNGTVYAIDPSNGNSTTFATGLPVQGGDLVINNAGDLFLVQRFNNQSSKLYNITTGSAAFVADINEEANGAAITASDGFIAAEGGSSNFHTYDGAGVPINTLNAVDNSATPIHLEDGDMASACLDQNNVEQCQNFEYYYISNDYPAYTDGVVYKGEIVGGDFVLTQLFNTGMSGHIALNANNGNIYVINHNGNNLQTYDASGNLLNDVPTGLPNTPALVWNPADGMVYAGTPTNGTVYAIDPANGNSTVFATGLPVDGGDLVVNNAGELFLVERSNVNPSKLYNITTGSAVYVGDVSDETNGIAITATDGFITAEGGSTNFHTFDGAGVPMATLNAVDNGGNPIYLDDGDLASACMDQEDVGECLNFEYYYVADNTPGIPQGNVYKGDIAGGDFVLTYFFNTGMSSHIALNTNNGDIYAIGTNGNDLKTFDAGGNLVNSVNVGLNATVALVWNSASGMVYTASNNGTVYEIDPANGNTTIFASGLPVQGGDLVINNAGDLFLIARDGGNPSHLYNITTGSAVLVADVNPAVNGAALTDVDGFIMAEGLNSNYFHTYDGNGAPLVTLNAVDNGGNPFPVVDGDMASGCMSNNPPIAPLAEGLVVMKLTSFPNPTSGNSEVIFSASTTARATVEVYDMNGRKIKTMFDQVANANQEYRLDFNGAALPNGVYIYKLTINEGVKIEKFMIAH